MYAKYLNPTTVEYFHGKALTKDGVTVANPTDSHMRAAGFKPLSEDPIPDGDGIILRRYEENEDYIRVYFERRNAGGKAQ